jgi:hypothetical protein
MGGYPEDLTAEFFVFIALLAVKYSSFVLFVTFVVKSVFTSWLRPRRVESFVVKVESHFFALGPNGSG